MEGELVRRNREVDKNGTDDMIGPGLGKSWIEPELVSRACVLDQQLDKINSLTVFTWRRHDSRGAPVAARMTYKSKTGRHVSSSPQSWNQIDSGSRLAPNCGDAKDELHEKRGRQSLDILRTDYGLHADEIRTRRLKKSMYGLQCIIAGRSLPPSFCIM